MTEGIESGRISRPSGAESHASEWDVIGYADRLSVRPDEVLRVMVSSSSPTFSARVFRLGGPEPIEAAIPGQGTYPGRGQKTRIGSYAQVDPKGLLDRLDGLTLHLWIWPTLPAAGRAQGLVTRWRNGEGWGLFIDEEGCLVFKASTAGHCAEIKFPTPLRPRVWYEILLAVSFARREARLVQRPVKPWEAASTRTDVTAPFEIDVLPAESVHLLIGAAELEMDMPLGFASGHFEGKIDEVSLFADAVDACQPGQAEPAPAIDLYRDRIVCAWDFSLGIESSAIRDVSSNQLDGTTFNMPARGMTGHRWDATAQSPSAAPEQYSAIHFHSDDFEDAAWQPDFEVRIPPDLDSGAYLVRLSGNRDASFDVPFFVIPPARSSKSIVVVMPTFTYLAYGNDHLWGRTDIEHGVLWPADRFENPDPADTYLAAHRDLGLALYDRHVDGSGSMYASRLRPLVNMRSDYRYWQSDGPRHLSADVLLLQWLERHGFRYDVITDEELHDQGLSSVAQYKVLLTGSHPEYYSQAMFTAVESYVDAGGKLMYLGGNGFYWVTSVDPEKPHIIEVRRGVAGSRNWTSEPGESHHSTTGELGGLWRHRGRKPNELVGIGFSAMGYVGASGYARLPDSRRSEVAFIFQGVGEDEVIGNFGTVLGGAAGDELDRYDPDLGSPLTALRLASTNALNDSYQLCVEDVLETVPHQDGFHSDKVRGDLVYLTRGDGGAVFSVGSINWIVTLGHNSDGNNVSRVTENVLRHFLEA